MKSTIKTTIIITILMALSMNAFAMNNSLQKYITDPAFEKIYTASKESDISPKEIEKTYQQFLQEASSDYVKGRGSYAYALWLLDAKDKDSVKKVLDYMTSLLNNLTDPFEKDCLNIDILCVKSASERNLHWGLKLQDAIKEYVKNWPDEAYSYILDGYRHENTPGFVGGSSKKAIEIFEELLPYDDILETELRFSLYKGLMTSYYNKKDYQEAAKWMDKANALFPNELEIKNLTAKLVKKLSSN